MKNFKPLFHEILWLIVCLIFTIAINFALLGKSLFEKDIDINLHDTYFIINKQHFLISFFIVFSFFVYFIKEKRHAFVRKWAFFIFLILGLSFSALITKASPLLSLLSTPANNGWTIYPPLSVIGKNQNILPKENFSSYFFTASNVLLAIQILIIASMLFATYEFGKSRNK